MNARELLERRYGNPQIIVSSHMNALIKLPKISRVNDESLRELYDKVEVNIRALNSAGITAEHFGALLIPIVLEKLPNIIRLQVSRTLGSDNWHIQDFMQCINAEITARESFEFLKNDSVNDDNSENDGLQQTTSSLAVTLDWKSFVFCSSREHYSDKCDTISDI